MAISLKIATSRWVANLGDAMTVMTPEPSV